VYPVTNPVHNGIAGATTGLIKGSIVVGYFADHAKQVPLITGSLGGVQDSTFDFPKADRGEDFNEVLTNKLPAIGPPELKSVVDKTIGSILYTGQGIETMLKEIGEGDILGAIQSAKQALSDLNNLKNTIVEGTIDQITGIVQAFASDAENTIQQATGISTTGIGTIVNAVDSVTSSAQSPTITDSINNLAGNIATRTSKTPITTTQDAASRITGNRFVMNTVMPHLDDTLNTLLGQK
jgi:hypothetical protein